MRSRGPRFTGRQIFQSPGKCYQNLELVQESKPPSVPSSRSSRLQARELVTHSRRQGASSVLMGEGNVMQACFGML